MKFGRQGRCMKPLTLDSIFPTYKPRTDLAKYPLLLRGENGSMWERVRGGGEGGDLRQKKRGDTSKYPDKKKTLYLVNYQG